MGNIKIESFEQLNVWQKSQDLAVDIYKLTKDFPSDELFAITNQLRRAASSISANIAEGFGRQTNKDKLHFYVIAYGSLLEVKNFLYLSNKLL
jgi:four helix bundle protein